MNATSPVCSHGLYITTQEITYCISTDRKLRGLFRTYRTVKIGHVLHPFLFTYLQYMLINRRLFWHSRDPQVCRKSSSHLWILGVRWV